jgi:hypothetical protein
VRAPPDYGRGRSAPHAHPGPEPQPITPTDSLSVADGRGAECRGCGQITDLIQGSDWCWTCVYTDPPYVDYAGRPALRGTDSEGMPYDR